MLIYYIIDFILASMYNCKCKTRQPLETSDRAHVLKNGRIVTEGACAELLEIDHVRKAYLGL